LFMMDAKKESYIWDEIDISTDVYIKGAPSKDSSLKGLEFRNDKISIGSEFGKKFDVTEDSELDVLSEISSALKSQRLTSSAYSSNHRANRSYSSNRSVETAISSLDDDNDDEEDIVTYSNLSESRNGIKNKERSFHPSNDNDNLAAIAANIEEKLKAMKEELHVRDTKGKELKMELQRLVVATERRQAREQRNWETQIQNAREQHAEILKKLSDFRDKLQSEVVQLREKQQSLSHTLQSNYSSNGDSSSKRSLALSKARSEAAQRIQQTKKQLQSDERALLVRAAEKREEAAKKAIAEGVYGPKLERLVQEGKQAVQERREQQQVALQRLRTQLQTECEQQLSEQRQRQADELAQAVERARRQCERKIEEQRAQHERQLASEQQAQQRSLQQVQEAASAQNAANAAAHQQAVKSLTARDTQLVQDLMEKQQQEVAELLAANAAGLGKLRQQLRDEQVSREEQRRLDRQQQQANNRQRVRDETQRALQDETRAVLQKIRNEAAERRRGIKARTEQQLQQTLSEDHTRLDSLRDAELKNRGMLAALEEEVAGLKQKTAGMSERLKTLQRVVSMDFKPQLAIMREELRAVEKEYTAMEESHANDVAAALSLQAQKLEELEKEEMMLKEQSLLQSKASIDKRDAAVIEYNAEISRIKEKILVLMKKKQGALQDLRNTVSELRCKNQELENSLEQIRNAANYY